MLLFVYPPADLVVALGTAAAAIIGAFTAGIVQVQRTRAEVRTLSTRVDSLEAEVSELRARERDLLDRLAEARAAVIVRDERIAELERELSAVRARLDELTAGG